MKQFIAIDQLSLNEHGTLVCKNPSGRYYLRAHFKQGELDGVSCAYSIAITFNILNVLNAEDTSWNRNEHEKATAGWELIRFLNTPSLYPKGISSNDIIKISHGEKSRNTIEGERVSRQQPSCYPTDQL